MTGILTGPFSPMKCRNLFVSPEYTDVFQLHWVAEDTAMRVLLFLAGGGLIAIAGSAEFQAAAAFPDYPGAASIFVTRFGR